MQLDLNQNHQGLSSFISERVSFNGLVGLSKNWTLDRFFHIVAMSVYLFPLPVRVFFGLSLAFLRSHDQFKASHWSTLLPSMFVKLWFCEKSVMAL